ncbi:unnamed protein product [marine sediment metagenome]|uniref:Uncharacterized protein n=1 Tax=marine sediment metagenome TaxID=412755 RepID=X1T0V6_9ZZZZ
MTILPTTPEETRLSLKALRRKLNEAYPYSYGYQGTPAYIELAIASISLRLQRLISTISSLESHCPGKFYKPRKTNQGR